MTQQQTGGRLILPIPSWAVKIITGVVQTSDSPAARWTLQSGPSKNRPTDLAAHQILIVALQRKVGSFVLSFWYSPRLKGKGLKEQFRNYPKKLLGAYRENGKILVKILEKERLELDLYIVGIPNFNRHISSTSFLVYSWTMIHFSSSVKWFRFFSWRASSGLKGAIFDFGRGIFSL